MDCAMVDSWFANMDFESCLTEDTTLMNIPSTNSINSSFCAEDFTELLMMDDPYDDHEPPNKLQRPNDYSNVNCFSTVPDVIISPDDDRHHKSSHNNNAIVTSSSSSTPIILNFENGNSSPGTSKNNSLVKSRDLNPDEEAFVSEVLRSQDRNSPDDDGNNNIKEKLRCVEVKKKTSRARLPSQNYDHIIAERKRREQLSQKFLALSTMVPGLKKMDKTSVLGDAINYLKHLQDKVQTLEAQAKKHTMESSVVVKKSSQKMLEDEEDSSDDKSSDRSCCEEQSLPEIEVRVSNNQILLKIQCHKRVGVVVNLLNVIEKLKLNIASTNVTTFGEFALDVTVVAEMEADFDLTVKEVVKRLREVLSS